MSEQDKTENKNIHGKPEISSGRDIAITSSQWYGAAVFYLLNLGKIPMKELWSRKYARRNLWTGYFMKLLFLGLVLFLAWKFYLKDTV